MKDVFVHELFITARKRSYGQGNVFTPVCHSVQGISVPACITGHMTGGSLSRWSLSKGVSGGLSPGVLCPGGSLSGRPPVR